MKPELQTLIRHSMVARIATLSRSGRPSITPLYFVCVDDHLWLGTASWTLAAREAVSNPRVCVLFQRTPNDRRIVRVTGPAVVRTDTETMTRSRRMMAFKYVLSPGGLINHLANWRLRALVSRYRAQSAGKGGGCIIDITPEQVEVLELKG